jgi:hypothetical protein
MNEVPLIYTSKGNLPEAELQFEPIWEVTDDYIKLRLVYKLKDEVVKESAFILSKRGLSSDALAHPLC